MTEALYRKYRPQVFSEVVGQDHIEQTLKNAIAQDKVSHAYLFCGPRGTGKTTTARLLSKALLCSSGPTPQPDGTCEDCQMIAAGAHPDVYELDAASRTGVENVREEIIGRVQFAPTRGKYKVYIIDEVHMLSTAAFNALLKTLEEPPSHVVFILCTTDPQKVPETIHSRCQRFDFRRISQEYLVGRLGAVCAAEGVPFEGEALELIAHRAEGGMRNALTALEQVISFGGGSVTLKAAEDVLGSLDSSDLAEIVELIGKRDVAGCFAWVAKYAETGSDLAQFTRDLAEHVRNLYVLVLGGVDVPLEVSDAERSQMQTELQWYGPDRLSRMMGVLGDLMVELKTSTNPRLSFEIACTRLVRPDSDLTLESLAERVEALESGYSAVAHVSAVGAAPAVMPAPAVANVRLVESAAPAIQAASAAQGAPVPTASAVAEPVVAPAAQQRASAVQATVSEPEFQPVTPAGDLAATLANSAALQRGWASAMNLLKREKPAYAVLLMSAKVHYQEDKNLVLVDFPKDSSFAYKAVQKPEVTEDLTAVLRQTFGASVPFAYVQSATGQSASLPTDGVQMRPSRTSADQSSAPQRQTREQVAQSGQRIGSVQSRNTPREERRPREWEAKARLQTVPQIRVPRKTASYDEVPLDAYGDMTSFGGAPAAADAPPWEPILRQVQPAPQPQEPQPEPQPQSANELVPQQTVVTSDTAAVATAAEAPVDSSAQSDQNGEESPEKMGALFSQVFETPIYFKE